MPLSAPPPLQQQATTSAWSPWTSAWDQQSLANSFGTMALFVFQRGTDTIYLLLYIDDIVLTASSAALLQQTISTLKQKFATKDLGPLYYFLGVSVQHQADGLFLTQHQFALDILERVGMVDCKPVLMPVDTHTKISVESGPPVADPTHFRSFARAL
jgi:hypothetical protein